MYCIRCKLVMLLCVRYCVNFRLLYLLVKSLKHTAISLVPVTITVNTCTLHSEQTFSILDCCSFAIIVWVRTYYKKVLLCVNLLQTNVKFIWFYVVNRWDMVPVIQKAILSVTKSQNLTEGFAYSEPDPFVKFVTYYFEVLYWVSCLWFCNLPIKFLISGFGCASVVRWNLTPF